MGAGLETGLIDDNFRIHCPGGATFYGRYFKCHIKTGHGVVDLHKGIVQSCDVFFYNVGNRLGIDTIAQYAEAGSERIYLQVLDLGDLDHLDALAALAD